MIFWLLWLYIHPRSAMNYMERMFKEELAHQLRRRKYQLEIDKYLMKLKQQASVPEIKE